jgi:acyl-CoA synthetase (AMP-forming)/AMP-acid ligase II
VSSGGAPVPPNLIERIGDRSANLIRSGNGYGLTETTSAVVVNSGDEYYAHPDSVGRPVPVAELRRRLRDRLAQFKIPSHIWVSTGDFPRSATGKVLKRDLYEAARAGRFG